MHWMLVIVSGIILFVISMSALEGARSESFQAKASSIGGIAGALVVVLGLFSAFYLDDYYQYEGHIPINKDVRSKSCFITFERQNYDLHDSWYGVDSMHVYSQRSERVLGFIRNDDDGRLILREMRDPRFDNVIEKMEN